MSTPNKFAPLLRLVLLASVVSLGFMVWAGLGAASRLPNAGPAAHAAGTVQMVVTPLTTTVLVGQPFTVAVQIQAGAQPFVSAQACLDFDPAVVQVQQITSGPTLELPLANTYNNTAGTLCYAGGTFASPPPSGTITLMQVRMIAVGSTPWSALAFHTAVPRQTDVAFAGNSVLGSVSQGQLVINTPPAELLTVSPNVGAQGAVVTVTLVGTNTNWSPMSAANFGPGIAATLMLSDNTHALTQLTIAPNAPLTTRAVSVTSLGQTVVLPNAFTVQRAGIGVTLPLSATGANGTQVRVPVIVNQACPICFSFEITIAFDPTVLAWVGVGQPGTLTENWQVIQTLGDGQVTIVGYGTTGWNASGNLVELIFDVVGAPGTQTPLTFNRFVFNEGDPAVNTTDGLFIVTRRQASLGGRVLYSTSLRPVPNALLMGSTSPSGTYTSTTNASGSYSLTLPAGADVTVVVTKTDDLRISISALDAAWIAQAVAGRRTFSAEQLQICEVSGNGTCTAYDAALIALYLVGSPDYPPTARVGRWQFTPPTRTYPQYDATLAHEDYRAFVLGDVTYNWDMGGQLLRPEAEVALSLPVMVGQPGGTLAVPIMLSPVQTEQGVLGYLIEVTYDPQVVTLANVTKANTLSAGWSVVAHTPQAGVVRLVGYGIDPLTSGGALVQLNFVLVGTTRQHTPLTLSVAQLNEGQPALQTQNGEVWVGMPVFLAFVAR